MKDEKYYRRQIKGLILILSDGDGTIHRSYVAEKLKNARKQIKDVNTHSIGKVKERLGKWIIK